MIHDLKCWLQYLSAIADGSKTFEARKDDRGYSVGDTLSLHGWDHVAGRFSGPIIDVEVTYILRGPAFGVEAGYCIMAIRRVAVRPSF